MSGIDGKPLMGRELDQYAEACLKFLACYDALKDSQEYGRRLEEKIRDKTPLPVPLQGVSQNEF